MVADDEIVEEEIKLIELVSTHHPYLKELTGQNYNDIVDRIRKRLASSSWQEEIKHYVAAIPTEWTVTAFLLAIDLALVDGKLHVVEEQFIFTLIELFDIPQTKKLLDVA
jgi:hypothetical protein